MSSASEYEDFVQSFSILLSDDDVEVAERTRIRALMDGEEVLGNESRAARALADMIPRAAFKHLSSILPPDLRISELLVTFSLGGRLCGIGLDGEVAVKLKPIGPS